jgi:hypothetical protein
MTINKWPTRLNFSLSVARFEINGEYCLGKKKNRKTVALQRQSDDLRQMRQCTS